MPIASINPATGETLRTFEPHSARAVEEKLARAADAFPQYRLTSFAERAAIMNRVAGLLEREQRGLGELITLEMGKPVKASVAEIVKCAGVCRYYAKHAEAQLSDEIVETSAAKSFVRYEPLGPILAIMPWNFPFWQVFRFAAPALMAGNVALLKHASSVPQCSLAIEELFREAGFQEGVFQALLIGSREAGELLEDRRIKAATLTGSEAAGRSVASRAGKNLKKIVLELGGSDPFIVTASANLSEAIETGVKARTVNSGQSCIAAKRFILLDPIAAEFEDRFIVAMQALSVGDPMNEATEIGPLATPQILENVDKQVQASVKAGAALLTGGKRLQRNGNFYEPTVLADIPESSPAFREEVFGPVASLFRVKTIDEAIALANQTDFGLGASVWTSDPAERAQFISELDCGQVFINAMVASDPRLPFGGVKNSGFGRELGLFGIREFVNIKTVWDGG